MTFSSRSLSNHFLTRFSEMILSSEGLLNINHLMTNEIKSVFTYSLYIRNKSVHVSMSCTLENSIVHILEMEMIH